MTTFADLGISVRHNGPAEQRVPCPWCAKGKRDDALGVNIETGVYHCFRCGASGRVGTDRGAPILPNSRSNDPDPVADPARLEAIWRRTLPLAGSVGETYLRHRRCALPPADSNLRFLPGTDRYPPSLCALVTHAVTAEPRTLHFTRLAPDGRGKAGTERDKLLLAGHRKAGGVIRLWPDEAVTHGLAIGEGIESSLAGAHAYTPVWATVDAGNMAAFPVLAGIESLVIFADHDEAGMRAARACAERWADAGREVELVIPERVGADVNDVVAA